MFEIARVESHSYYVRSRSLCVGFCGRYGDCCTRHVGCAGTTSPVASFARSSAGVVGDAIYAEWDAQAPRGMLQPLCGLSYPALGLCRHYVGYLSMYGDVVGDIGNNRGS